MEQKQGPGRQLGDHPVGAEIVNALRGLDGKLHDRIFRQMAPHMFGDGNDVEPRHPERLAGLLAVPTPVFEHLQEFLPGAGTRVLALQFFGAMPPAADRDDGGDAIVGAPRIGGHRAAHAVSQQADFFGVDTVLLGQPGYGVAGVGDLVE